MSLLQAQNLSKAFGGVKAASGSITVMTGLVTSVPMRAFNASQIDVSICGIVIPSSCWRY